tara:strand:- start:606 stop:1661 length:1056 start_codon:yes stop_codon:yes gene_type:complete
MIFVLDSLTRLDEPKPMTSLEHHSSFVKRVQKEFYPMNQFGYSVDEKITSVLENRDFTLSAEIVPPRNGTEQQKVLSQIDAMVNAGSLFLSVTKGAGGSLRGGSLPISQTIKDRFSVPVISHFTCRDITPQEIENQLMDHHYFGIRNILALRGDPPQGQEEWKAKEGSYSYGYQLIEQIRNLNHGNYLVRPGAQQTNQEKTDFCIGAAAHPEHPNKEERIQFFKRKVEAGAEFAITQMIYDPDLYSRFLDECANKGIFIPVLAGFKMLRSQKEAIRLSSRFGISVPNETIKRLPEEKKSDNLNQALEVTLDFIELLKRKGAPGVHVFVLSETEGSAQLLRELAKPENQGKG